MKLPQYKLKQVTVIGDSSATPQAIALAEQVGAEVAESGYAILTGGRGGIMEAANRGAYLAGGLSIGMLPSETMDDANEYCHIVLPTGLGHARNTLTALAGDAIVAIGGGAGTLSELCFGWIYQKPVFVFPQFGGWSEKISGTSIDHRRQQPIVACASVEELIFRLHSLFKHQKI